MEKNSTAIDHELRMWKQKIEEVISKFQSLPSGKKAKLTGYINNIQMVAAELDDRIELLMKSGYDGGDYWDNDVKVDIDEFRNDFTESGGMYMDYDYSG